MPTNVISKYAGALETLNCAWYLKRVLEDIAPETEGASITPEGFWPI